MSQQLPISFSDDNQNKDHTRGIQVTNRNISESIYSTPSVQQKDHSSSQQIDILNTTNNKPLGSSKYPQQIITLELDDAAFLQQKQAPELILSVASELKTETETVPGFTNNYYNNISSYAVPNQTCSQVFNGLKTTLFDYSKTVDMNIEINSNNNCIEGMVFMNGEMNGIKFKINIWKINETETRFELLRIDGDAMVTAKFLGDIQSKFFQKKQINFVSLGFDTSDLDLNELFDEDIKMEININEELNNINNALIRNDMCVMDELQYFYEQINENNNEIVNDIIKHTTLINTILNQLIKNNDIRVIRGCLIILQTLCNFDDKISQILCQKYKLINFLNVLLLNNKYSIIKNYVVKMLAKHTKYINKNICEVKNMKNGIEKYENEWKCNVLNGNGCINKNMFNKIYKRLSEIMQ